MATTFKNFLNEDVASARTLLHESIPVTGSIVSGTYNQGSSTTETNVKNFSHGLFQSVFDYPHLSSSANHIFDVTVGYSPDSTLSSSANTQNGDKIDIYNQMAQILVGHDATGSIRKFDEDGDLTGGTKMKEVFFVNFARLLNKDEVKKGSFNLELGADVGLTFGGQAFNDRVLVTDASGSSGYLVNSPAGEYGVLFATASTNTDNAGITYIQGTAQGTKIPCGLIFYQAGIAVLSGSVFNKSGSAAPDHAGGIFRNGYGDLRLGNPIVGTAGASHNGFNFITGSSISGSADAIRNRIYNISFNNTTELNSTIYFCRASHNEFNYSSNPTYLSSSQIRVKDSSLDEPVSYMTTVGLYSANNELLAVAKVSEPLKKTPDTELTLRVRLDY
jgi:hypothetical protein|tara:strand:- start:1170 stop:2336 length:1167 start_codon:yes stop_codon:yes gene_type:complete